LTILKLYYKIYFKLCHAQLCVRRHVRTHAHSDVYACIVMHTCTYRRVDMPTDICAQFFARAQARRHSCTDMRTDSHTLYIKKFSSELVVTWCY